MKKILSLVAILLVISMIPIPAFASSMKNYPSRTHTYFVTSNNTSDLILAKESAKYWEKYGFHLIYSKKNPETVITIHNYCLRVVVGTFNTTDHTINIYAECLHNKLKTQQILSHEFGHFLGFDHYSDPIMFPSIE